MWNGRGEGLQACPAPDYHGDQPLPGSSGSSSNLTVNGAQGRAWPGPKEHTLSSPVAQGAQESAPAFACRRCSPISLPFQGPWHLLPTPQPLGVCRPCGTSLCSPLLPCCNYSDALAQTLRVVSSESYALAAGMQGPLPAAPSPSPQGCSEKDFHQKNEPEETLYLEGLSSLASAFTPVVSPGSQDEPILLFYCQGMVGPESGRRRLCQGVCLGSCSAAV